MENKKLIINADDFGICEQTNKAIKELFINNKITSTSLLANASATENAMQIAKELDISVGVHLTLNSDFKQKPWEAMLKGSSISDDEGFLLSDTNQIAKMVKSSDVTKECAMQIDYIIDNGVKVNHLDNHSGTMYGINKRLFFINAFKLCRRYNLPFRFPMSNRFLSDYFKGDTPAIIKIAHKIIVSTAKVMKVRLIDDMVSNPYSIADINSYRELEKYYLNAISNLREGVTELFMHPSYHCEEFSPYTKEWKKREYELELLNSQVFENRLKEEGVQLISYSDLLR